jgi:hypothetical protein
MPALSLSGQTKQRQIVILAVGGVLLGGLLLFQVPRTLKMLEGSEAAPVQQPSQSTPAPTPVSPTATPAPTPTPGSFPATSDGSSPQHVALTRFTSKDPFVQQVNPNGAAGTGSSESASSSQPSPAAPAESETSAGSGAVTAGSSSGTSAGTTATIAVNGAEETVSVAGTFPQGNPVFKLVSVTDDSAKVGVASGKLKGGTQTVTLNRGEPLTLLNTVDGKRYRLELVSVTE